MPKVAACSRIEPNDLVEGAHIIPEVSEGVARLVVGLAAFTGVALLGTITAWLVNWLLLILFVPSGIAITCFLSRPIHGPALAEFIHERWVAPRKRLPILYTASYGDLNTVSAISAGDWVCLKSSYDAARRNYHATHGRSVPDPNVEYSFVLATFALSGTQRVVAFSNGSSMTWHPTSKVIVRKSPGIRVLLASDRRPHHA